MNTDKIFQAKKEWMLLLINLGMPSIIMEKMLAISSDTVRAYRKKLNARSLPTEEEAKSHMLKIYAQMHGSSSFEYGDVPFRQALKTALAEVLEERRILQTLEYAVQGVYSFAEIRYTDDVSVAYRKLVDDIYHHCHPTDPRVLWENYLKQVRTLQIDLTPKQFSWEKGGHFIQSIIKGYAEDMRESVAPIITGRICEIIDMYATNDVIRQYYGFGECPPKTFMEIAISRGQSRERIRQIYNRYFAQLKSFLKKEIFPVSDSWDRIHQMQASHNVEIDRIKDLSAKKMLEIDQKYQQKDMKDTSGAENVQEKALNPIDNPLLLQKIEEVNLSVRTINCMKSADTHYLWELMQFTEHDLWRIRNLGKWSINEIKEFMERNNLKLGVDFSLAEIGYLESKTKNA